MTIVDRFICRREGHVPAFEITSPIVAVESIITTCRRCGKAITLVLTDAGCAAAGPNAAGEETR